MAERKRAERWCLGYRVEAEVILKDGSTYEDPFPITVSALNPKEIKANEPQGRGLFLDGPRVDDPEIAKINAIVRERRSKYVEIIKKVDVTRFVRQGYGPGL